MRLLLSFAASFAILGPLTAQLPVGAPTPLGGVSPRLEAEPLWLGNLDYGYRIRRAPANAPGILVLSLARDAVSVVGVEVGVSLQPQHLLLTVPFTTDAMGEATIHRPLAGPSQPALLGALVFAQAAIVEPSSGTLAATETLQLQVKLPPAMHFSGDAVPSQLMEPFTGQVTLLPIPLGETVLTSLFINGGADLIAATASAIFHADLLAPIPSFTLLAPLAVTQLAWDPVHRRIFCHTNPTLQILDGRRDSPNFGSIRQTLPMLEGFGLSADGSKLLTRDFVNQQGPQLQLFDVEPGSPTYTQVIQSIAIVPSIFGHIASWTLAADGRSAYYFQFGGVIPQIQLDHADLTTGTWIDHDPTTPGTQPLGVNSPVYLPNLGMRFFIAGGRTMFTRSSTGGYLQVDLDFGNLGRLDVAPATFAQPIGGGFPIGSAFVGITTSEKFLMVRTGTATPTGGTISDIGLMHMATGITNPWFSFTTNSLADTAIRSVWR